MISGVLQDSDMKVLKSITVILLTLLSATTIAVADSNCVPVFTRYGNEVVYQVGERMDFVLHYHFAFINSDIGTATVTLDTTTLAGEKNFHCRVAGSTTKGFDRIFKVREDFQSWFSYDDLIPRRFTRDTREGSYVARNEFSYMWNDAEPYIDAQIYSTSIGYEKVVKIPLKPCTFDLPSLFFFARNIDMRRVALNVKYPMTFVIDDDVYDVYFVYRGRCVKEVKGLGTIKCLHFGAKLLEGGVFKGDNELEVYISDDRNRLPVLFGAPIHVGDVEGRMTSVSGLKYPFTAKMD